MASATVTSKGQVTIPAEVRQQLGVSAGDRLDFVLNEASGRYEVIPATYPVTSLKGIIRKPARPVSIEDMNAAVAQQGGKSR